MEMTQDLQLRGRVKEVVIDQRVSLSVVTCEMTHVVIIYGQLLLHDIA